ncbi:uncharacterized protein TrAFT101_000839 [Trichoderma asperellum]|uniref:Uncharacterized protein n=1 Tax=Trichoderma asperellum (strain ATCC 204424 / CBS 433.97 / NBRC 101777) TaxID=1042311 RepID=A0A2T3ZKT6_TRIA4|nr:hypothetical protein M441DRAFT_65050 [Trichoderma asperellum CBS 433.97]PTB45392.1 hypothetical protein M441DRAFT_65050 [Trichoderma asperellum CBS 433.97]UKZ84958.1 hypothetical protein TrAFT101_000839 [Trichoderma asperellum]
MAFTNAICIILPIFLCLSIVLCLVFFTVRATAHDDMPPRVSSSDPETVIDDDHLVLGTRKNPQRRITNIRDIFLRDERVYLGDEESDTQPLLSGELYDNPLEQPPSVHMVITGQGENMHGKHSINWHGTNTLNTPWAWMA